MDWDKFVNSFFQWFIFSVIAALFFAGLNFFEKRHKGEDISFDDFCSDFLSLAVGLALSLSKDYITVLSKGSFPEWLLWTISIIGVFLLIACFNAYSILNHRTDFSVTIPGKNTIAKIEQEYVVIVEIKEENNRFDPIKHKFSQLEKSMIKLLTQRAVKLKTVKTTALISCIYFVVLEIVILAVAAYTNS